MTYEQYLDKVYGCFLGKTVAGTMGAPYEGIKMPLELQFKPEMINTMLPNDDLDLQVLWLDAVKQYGEDFTSYDLQKVFCENCDYSPGEYAIMRKNYEKGIYPPESGRFCNDFYIQGMGCPIRSEIWACLYPAQPGKAADMSARDGCLDHEGESVYAERFFAALESAAFYESDLDKLIDIALCEIPADCKIRTLIADTLAWCREYEGVKQVLAR
ncbi:MAG: ADP-ribosylglycohydrolase family protein, partial [Clostridia bacterium]|nr:ADP-ribosylglycohydrolase family protein [Clostridia bacterium]